MNCCICGRDLGKTFKTKCFDCFKKTELKGKKDIKQIMSKLGENSTAGRKYREDYKKIKYSKLKYGKNVYEKE